MTTLEMMFLIFAVFLLVPVGLFFLIFSAGNVLTDHFPEGFAAFILFIACAGAVYYLLTRYRE